MKELMMDRYGNKFWGIRDFSKTYCRHHISYFKTVGVEKCITMERGEHKALHHRIRNDGKCLYSVIELENISSKAYKKTNLHTRQLYSFSPERYASVATKFQYNSSTSSFSVGTCFDGSGYRQYLKRMERT